MPHDLYTEKSTAGKAYREEYLRGVLALIRSRADETEKLRNEYISPEKLAVNREKYRGDYISMLGWPLNTKRPSEAPRSRSSRIGSDELGDIYRVQLEIFPDFYYYGMLFSPHGLTTKTPIIISQHGGSGTPEICSDLYQASNYNDMTRRILRHGAIVFAPQMLLWDKALDGNPSYDRVAVDAALKQSGGSITALELYCLSRAIDWLITLDHVDADKIGMIGLSYGGFYSLFAAAADRRIKAACSSCFFNDRTKYAWPDWTWLDASSCFLDAEIGALVAPRALAIQVAKNDEIFSPDGAEHEYKRLEKFFAAQHADKNLRFHVFDGVHEFDRDNGDIDFVLEHLNK